MELLGSSQFATHVEELMNEWHVPGLAFAIVHKDQTVSKGFGKSSLSPPKPCTPATLFDIGSCSKSLTAASVALLVVDNVKYPHVQWDAIMSKLLPDDFVMSKEDYTAKVTVEDILSHRTGLPPHGDSSLGRRAAHPDTAQSITRNLRNLQIGAPIRSKFMYSNLMYTVASYLVEKISGSSFADFLKSHFFEPIGMSSTNLQPDTAKAAGLGELIAIPYVWNPDSHTHQSVELRQCPEDQGASCIITSADDYIKYVKTFMRQETPILENVYKDLVRPRIIENPDDDDLDPHTSWNTYAAGWWPRFYRGSLVILHEGAVEGFGSIHFFLPTEQFGGVVFGNSSGAQELAPILAHELIDDALKVSFPERPDWNALYVQRKFKNEEKDEEGRLRRLLCPESDGTPQPQKLPLHVYTGEYWNTGYHGLVVEVKDGRLFVNAADRSQGFYLTFEHVCDQMKYIAHLEDYSEGGDEPFHAEFRFENDKVVQMGLGIEPELDDLIWFDKADSQL